MSGLLNRGSDDLPENHQFLLTMYPFLGENIVGYFYQLCYNLILLRPDNTHRKTANILL